MNIKYKVTLTEEERKNLENLTSKSSISARKMKRAQILLLAENHKYKEHEIVKILKTSPTTIYRTKQNFVEYGLEFALNEKVRPGQPRKLSANQEALLIATACTPPPSGHCRWTLSLLGDRLITLTDIESISLETIRQRLKQNDLKPWKKNMVHRKA